MEQDWKIQIIGQDVSESQGSILILEWTLNHTPDPEWTPFLEHSNIHKSGSATFAFSEPRVSGNKIHLPAEDRDMEAAASFIEKSVSSANEPFAAEVLTRRQREAEQKQAQEAPRRPD